MRGRDSDRRNLTRKYYRLLRRLRLLAMTDKNNMDNKLENIGVVILAAGKGTRLGCVDIPKVMLELNGKPIISYIVETLKEIGFGKEQIMLVVGFKKEKVMEYFGDEVSYINQEEQLGTAHAVYTGSNALPQNLDTVLIFQGDDSAFLKPETVKKLINQHIENKADFTLMTVNSEDETLGRVIRDKTGKLADVLEKEEVNEENAHINERNTNTFITSRAWEEDVFKRLEKIEEINEYGIPQFVPAARKELEKVEAFTIEDSKEFHGINTPEQLEEANKIKTSHAEC